MTAQIDYSVQLTQGAERDLETIYDYVCAQDCVEHANDLFNKLVILAESLAQQPERGSYPKELLALGIKDYRQVFFKPYRVIYRIIAEQVLVYLIVDGRRDLQSWLEQRLLRA